MPVDPNLLERLWRLRLNGGHGPVLDLFGAASFEAVTFALDRGSSRRWPAIRRPSTSSPAGSARTRRPAGLLEFFAAQGYVAEGGGRYRKTPMTGEWLLADPSTNGAPWLRFLAGLVFPFR